MSSRAVTAALSALSLVVAVALLLGPVDASGAELWAWPVEGEVITEYRNGDDPYAPGQHRGIDIAGAVGAPAVAAVAGTVRYRGVAGSSGLTVSIRTADGRFDTSYLHLASATVEKGQVVGAGERLGTVGTSGRRSAEAPHLHFGVREAGSRHAYLDPSGFLGPPPAPLPTEPRGAPAPVEAPLPVVPAPSPVTVPVASPAPLRVPARRRVRVPAARRVRAPGERRVRVPAPGLRPLPARAGVPSASAGPVAVPGLGSAPAGAPSPRAASPIDTLGPGPTAQPAQMPDAAPRQEAASPLRPRSGPAVASRPGPDLGWAIACVGLLLAAACVGGRPAGSQGEPQARRATLKSLLRPLTGGR